MATVIRFEEQIGELYTDRARVSCPDADLSVEPDLVVEIVSDASARKDTERLPAAYHRAGVEEFWLVDARGDDLLFRVHRRGPTAYEPVQPDGEGYQHSAVLASQYHLDRSRNARGRLTFDLCEKESS